MRAGSVTFFRPPTHPLPSLASAPPVRTPQGPSRGPPEQGPNLAKTKILAKYNTINQVDRLHGGTKPVHPVRE
jgi:hypothetical protein